MINRVLLIGCGRFGKHHLRNLENLGVLYAVVDTDKNLITQCPISCDYRKFIYEVDAIDICTPPEYHMYYCKIGIQFNKHIFIEKPLATDSKDLDDLGEIDQYDKNFMVGNIYDFTKELVILRNQKAKETHCTLIRPKRDRQSDLLNELGWHPIHWSIQKYGIPTKYDIITYNEDRIEIILRFGSNKSIITIAREERNKTEFIVGNSRMVDGKLYINNSEYHVEHHEPLADELKYFLLNDVNNFKESRDTTNIIDKIREAAEEVV